MPHDCIANDSELPVSM